MARINNIKTEISCPDKITINLVNEADLKVSNIFRTFFEIFLTLSGAIFGAIISMCSDIKTNLIYWIFLIIMLFFTICFLCFSIVYKNKTLKKRN